MVKDYMAIELEALKEEILRLHGSVVRILSIGIAGVPFIVGASLKFDLDPVIYISPLIVDVFILMLLFEQNSIMRAGRYIRLHIESQLKLDNFIGWETFLETNEINRRAEVFFAIASHATFAIYYIGGTLLAFDRLLSNYNIVVALLVTSLYTGAFGVSMYLVVKYFPIGTRLPGEARPKDPLRVDSESLLRITISGESSSCELDAGQSNERKSCAVEIFIVLGQTAALLDPGGGRF